MRAMRQATSAVGVPGFSSTGIPASSAQAIFSHWFQAGKLKALTCTAMPGLGTHTCCPEKRGVRPSCVSGPSAKYGLAPSSLPNWA
jgi:hypothetical protein